MTFLPLEREHEAYTLEGTAAMRTNVIVVNLSTGTAEPKEKIKDPF